MIVMGKYDLQIGDTVKFEIRPRGRVGRWVRGRVVAIRDDSATVDLGGKKRVVRYVRVEVDHGPRRQRYTRYLMRRVTKMEAWKERKPPGVDVSHDDDGRLAWVFVNVVGIEVRDLRPEDARARAETAVREAGEKVASWLAEMPPPGAR